MIQELLRAAGLLLETRLLLRAELLLRAGLLLRAELLLSGLCLETRLLEAERLRQHRHAHLADRVEVEHGLEPRQLFYFRKSHSGRLSGGPLRITRRSRGRHLRRRPLGHGDLRHARHAGGPAGDTRERLGSARPRHRHDLGPPCRARLAEIRGRRAELTLGRRLRLKLLLIGSRRPGSRQHTAKGAVAATCQRGDRRLPVARGLPEHRSDAEEEVRAEHRDEGDADKGFLRFHLATSPTSHQSR